MGNMISILYIYIYSNVFIVFLVIKKHNYEINDILVRLTPLQFGYTSVDGLLGLWPVYKR